MKKNKKRMAAVLVMMMLLSGCANGENMQSPDNTNGGTHGQNNTGNYGSEELPAGTPADLGGSEATFGEDISDDLYEGYFGPTPTQGTESSGETEDTADAPQQSTADVAVTINCEEGTAGCYKVEGNTITFTKLSADSVYSISGQFKGNIIIDAGDEYKLDLEMKGFSLISETTNPITVVSGDKVTLTAKKDTVNYIYDMREAVDSEDETVYSGAIHSEVDLKIGGKGELNLVSENNNGIHSKDDLEVKNLTLTVHCVDNALKGNDSVTMESANTTLIATQGDTIKTSNSDISSKGNQRGTVTITGGTHTLYAACDGIDAAYDVVIDDASTVLNIYTDKYSNYSEEVTAVEEDVYYIRFTSKNYNYSVKYYNSDEDYLWVNAEYHSTVSAGRSSYYYFSLPKHTGYSKMQFFIYSTDMQQGQAENYLAATDYLTINDGYDTFALTSRGNSLSYGWTNYTTNITEGYGGGGRGGMGGFGGMDGGNTDKGDHSTKGLKAANEIVINNGTINIKAYDDAIHANNDTTLENGATPKGNVTVNGGNITLYSNDDGLHADGTVTVANGTVTVTNSYEGVEGTNVVISGGKVTVQAKDDGMNGTATAGTAITISGGEVYIYCSGDGIDSNSRASYSGIVFEGGNTVVISNSGGNSAIDSEQGYKYTGGSVVAIMPSGGMSGEATHCSNFSSIGTNKTASLSMGAYVTVSVGNEEVVTIKMPVSLSGRVIYLGSNSASVSTSASSTAETDTNGVYWYK